MGLTAVIAVGVYLLIFRMGWGKQVRAVISNRAMAGAVGIDTERVDRLTFGLGCGIAGVAGSAFTMIGSTSPTAGQLYIVDTFLVVVFGGAQSLLGLSPPPSPSLKHVRRLSFSSAARWRKSSSCSASWVF